MLPLHWIGTDNGGPFVEPATIDLRDALPEGGNLFCNFTLRRLTAGQGNVRATLQWIGTDGGGVSSPAEIDLSSPTTSSRSLAFFKVPKDAQSPESELKLLIERDPETEGGSWTVDLDVR